MDQYFEIGKITGTHGIKGTFRVFPTTQSPKRFELLKEVIIENKGVKQVFEISKVAYHKQFVLLTVKGINDINIAEAYRGATLCIAQEQAIPLEENEYYMRDLYDMEVYTKEGEFLGTIREIYATGANDVYGVAKGEEKELLIPAIHDCILQVDVAGRRMTVNLLEGLKEE